MRGENLFDLVNLDLRMKASEEKKKKHKLDALYSLDACCIEDVDWDDLLGHRSGEVCQKRWDQMVKHLGEHSNKSFAEQVEVLSKRYRPDVLEAREAYDSKPACAVYAAAQWRMLVVSVLLTASQYSRAANDAYRRGDCVSSHHYSLMVQEAQSVANCLNMEFNQCIPNPLFVNLNPCYQLQPYFK
ncbi:hypothetical protein CMV_025745 [Castanea mollissima]|uniref:Myb-like domain-containing protein n=1 Tax=Castanea mollissima TaxID=60419 RepID=A0A8J4QJC5_9ROSI|nr:hypothetical protein CMV_025745 [Castanea mollissima]